MSKNESFASHVNRRLDKLGQSKESALITVERAQKLDLLIHLISNLRQSLVICGPHGIGKTTLLDELALLKADTWLIYKLDSSENLSFEKTLQQLELFLKQHDRFDHAKDLAANLSMLETNQQKIIFMIDNAGKLVPGLVTALIHYATTYECLRIVFSLTYDELHIKTSSDRVIEDCHFIEIPPLTEKQCETFLQNLSASPDTVISFRSINERMIKRLYQMTHGVPGKIVDELPNLSNYTAIKGTKWNFLGLIVVGGLVGWGILSQFTETKEPQVAALKPLIRQDAQVVKVNSPVIVTPPPSSVPDSVPEPKPAPIKPVLPNPKPDLATDISRQHQSQRIETATKKDKLEPISLSPKKSGKTQPVIKPVTGQRSEIPVVEPVTKVNKKDTKIDLAKKATKEVKSVIVAKQKTKLTQTVKKKHQPVTRQPKKASDDRYWLLSQPKNNYTLQLIVLSKRQSVKKFIQQHRKFKQNVRFFSVKNNGKTKYVVLYGTFKNSSVAAKEMRTLPVKYRKSWLRKFKDLQKMIKD